MGEHVEVVRIYCLCPIHWCTVLGRKSEMYLGKEKGKKREVWSWVKWNKHVLLTSVHFFHPSTSNRSQQRFKSSRSPNSGKRRVPASQGNQSLSSVVLNEFLKRGSTRSFLSFFLGIAAVRVRLAFRFSANIFFKSHLWSPFCERDDSPWWTQMFSVTDASSWWSWEAQAPKQVVCQGL